MVWQIPKLRDLEGPIPPFEPGRWPDSPFQS